ncbi:MAG: DEAD/DEAH box helicase [Candidatus Omnitrophica bacterium]|nr:DEAD/DEAH box helicase [Candidatus Omnitrophota bacterium]
MNRLPFQYDPFQKQAMEWIDKGESVLVSAPTGAGKTAIAEYALEQVLARGKEAIYTAPIKALSNQKYRDFSAKYGDRIGIITGDVAINPQAPILIMTTEIYRNTLFEDPRRVSEVEWVIFDEFHYIDDYARGTVWEESIMFSPEHIRFLCLSATIPNVEELADWMGKVCNHPVNVVVETHRPVPLTFCFQCQGQLLPDFKALHRQGYQNQGNWGRWRDWERRRPHFHAKPNRLDTLIRHLIAKEQLPCLYFTFGRQRTEQLAQELGEFNFLSALEQKQIRNLFEELLEKYQLNHEKSAYALRDLIDRGIAYHHAGMLPSLKEVVERLFTSGLIKMIFTTETFALGINMPARTVVFDELRKFYGYKFDNLRTRDFYQMAGRAGRRGMDTEGFVYVRVNPNDIPYHEVFRIITGKPEAVFSQFNTGYATVLNLYREFQEQLPTIYNRSLHHFQSSKKDRHKGYEALSRKLALLHQMGYLHQRQLTPKGEFASWMYGYELALAEMQEERWLDTLTDIELNVVLAALVYEPRKGEHRPHLDKGIKRLARRCEEFTDKIHHQEQHYKILPRTKPAYFYLAPAMVAWCNGLPFDKTLRLSMADEGEIVRYFRMAIQLLRQLHRAPTVSDSLRNKARKAIERINRDVVDAEWQLRVV